MTNLTSVLNQLEQERTLLAPLLNVLAGRQGKEGRFNHCPQENDFTSRSQKDCGCAKSKMGEVAEEIKVSISGRV